MLRSSESDYVWSGAWGWCQIPSDNPNQIMSGEILMAGVVTGLVVGIFWIMLIGTFLMSTKNLYCFTTC